MTKNKFFHVCSMMHVVDFSTLDPDSLHKIYDKAKPIMDLINKQCVAGVNWWPGRILTIDEAMRAYRGKRCRIMAFMPDKPIKRGLKLYMLNDADTGMVLCFILAAGDADVSCWDPVDLCAPHGDEEPFKAEGKMTFVCLRLMKSVLGKGHIVATDNAYTSNELAIHAFRQGTHMYGTMNPSRLGSAPQLNPKHKLVKGLMQGKPRGAYVAQVGSVPDVPGVYSTQVLYRDTADVNFLSTWHPTPNLDNVYPTPRWDKGTRSFITVDQPQIKHDYDHAKGGTDKFDQFRSYSEIGVQSKRVWQRLLYQMLDICCINAWLMYNVWAKSKEMAQMKMIEFKCQLAKELWAKAGHDDPQFDNTFNPHTPLCADQRGRCIVCWKYKQKLSQGVQFPGPERIVSEGAGNTTVVCSSCLHLTNDKPVYLCLGHCWSSYHKHVKHGSQGRLYE
jgi:hypothetical protein